MATHAAETAAHEHGQMDVAEHTATFKGVMGMFKWGSLWTAALLIFLTMWFCTPAGFFPAAAVTVIVLVLGGIFLRSKPNAGH